MLKYRLKFNFKKIDKIINRNDAINDILSDTDEIISDFPIRKPLDGEIVILSKEEYLVISSTISFEKEGDITYYDINTLVGNKKVKDELESKRKHEELLREIEKKRQMDKYKKSLIYGRNDNILEDDIYNIKFPNDFLKSQQSYWVDEKEKLNQNFKNL